MLHFIILDDDANYNELTAKRLELIIKKNNINGCLALKTTNPNEVTDYCLNNSSRNNVYLLDVNIHDSVNGIDIASMVRSQDVKGYIIFVSAYPEYVMSSLKTKVFDYLIKPVTLETLEACITSVYQDYTKVSKGKLQTLSIKSGFLVHNLKFHEIIYMEKFGHILVVHTTSGKIESSESLESIEKKLDKNIFYRCHKSYIVNILYISLVDYPKSIIYLKNGETCIVSKRCKKELKTLCRAI